MSIHPAADRSHFSQRPSSAAIGDREMARLLIDAGADPGSALATAVSSGRADMVQLLIDAGADCKSLADNGPALERVLLYGSNADPHQRVGTAIVLVRAGADGRKAFEIVRRHWILADALVDLLREAGAPDPHGLVFRGAYDEVAHALTDWTPPLLPREKKPPLIVRIIGGVAAVAVGIVLAGLGVLRTPEP